MVRPAAVTSFAAALVLVMVLSSCGGSRTAAPSLLSDEASSDIQFGTIKSITPLGRGYKVLFDLGIILSGATGVQSCVDNGQCPKSERHNGGFPDDIAAADLHYVLPYYLPPNAEITLFNAGTRLPCTARELYLLYHGRDPRHLIELDGSGPPRDFFGWWIKIRPGAVPRDDPLDSVVRVEQQRHP